MARLSRLNITTVLRTISPGGTITAEDWNDSFTEITTDLSNIANQWNNILVTLLSLLPDGTDDSAIDAFNNGEDGKTIYVDTSATSADATSRYFNSTKSRPNTIKEQIENIYSTINSLDTSLSSTVGTSTGTGLTDAEKAAIGIHIFDSTQTSAPTSLDGLRTTDEFNITQIGKDLYGTDFVLNGNGVAILNNSLKGMVGALLLLHNGSWSNDITLDHSNIPDFANLRTFTGQDDTNDTTPDYTSTNFVIQNTSLETAISALDVALNTRYLLDSASASKTAVKTTVQTIDSTAASYTSAWVVGTLGNGSSTPPLWNDGALSILEAQASTTDNTLTTALSIPLTGNQAFGVNAKVIGTTAATGASAFFNLSTLVSTGEGSIGAIENNSMRSVTASGWDASFSYSGSALNILVSGAISTSIKWRVGLELIGVVP